MYSEDFCLKQTDVTPQIYQSKKGCRSTTYKEHIYYER